MQLALKLNRRSTHQLPTYVNAGPSNWNSLPAHLRDNSLSLSSFRRHIKTFLFSFY